MLDSMYPLVVRPRRPNVSPELSVIVTTYNRPDALRKVLESLARCAEGYFEVVVADDGSTEETRDVILGMRDCVQYGLLHVWQPDLGFRAGASRNRAAEFCSAPYIVFLDGDCVVAADFVANHLSFARTKCLVGGHRILLGPELTNAILRSELSIADLDNSSLGRWLWRRCNGEVTKVSALFDPRPRIWPSHSPKRWRGVKSANVGLWRDDLLAVNGFDESFRGWGYEDSDLVIRLIRNGIARIDARHRCIVYHLWHRENDRTREQENLQRLQVSHRRPIRCEQGADQYSGERLAL